MEAHAGLTGSRTLLGAFIAFTVANLIHNDFGLDPAIVPAALLVGLYWWRRRRGLLWGAVLMIAVPAFFFLRWRALADPWDTLRFLNHLALFTAGALAVATAALSLLSSRRRARPL
jgi:hypothetical protein